MLAQGASSNMSGRKKYRIGRFFTVSWFVFIASAILWGWLNRHEKYINAESGLGYWLGIAGGSMMLLLLTYSLRKRWRMLRRLLSVKFWFRLHMTLGVLGPLAILFHGNFSIASLNSTIALVCMLCVAGSGIIGRYLYTRIHFGLYGEKVRLQQVLKDYRELKDTVLKMAVEDNEKRVAKRLFEVINDLIEEQKAPKGFFTSYKSRRMTRKVAVAMTKLVSHLLARSRKRSTPTQTLAFAQKDLRDKTQLMLAALDKLPGLILWERLFSLWHIIHIPIFIMMVITAVIHVVIVHMY